MLTIRRATDESGRSVFVAGPLDEATRRRAAEQPERLSEMFQVFVDPQEGANGWPAMAGTVTLEHDELRFRPAFPLRPGTRYRAVCHPSSGVSTAARLVTPEAPPHPPTTVLQVYPSARTIPENLLKLYVQFSAPMRQGEAYRHIRLLDEHQTAVELPFVEIRHELWDPTGTRLTLLIDPGRIKREVRPLEEIGPVFEAAKRYTLVVDPVWRDAGGAPLENAYQQEFRATEADRDAPIPGRWTLVRPAVQSREPLVVEFGEALDRALLDSQLWLVDSGENELTGSKSIGPKETSWSFVPSSPWSAGQYELVVGALLEDLAGNSVARPFEVVPEGDVRPPSTEPVRVRFRLP